MTAPARPAPRRSRRDDPFPPLRSPSLRIPSRLALVGLHLIALAALGGCTDRYLVRDSHLRLVNGLTDDERAHVAIPSVRVPSGKGAWVRADRVAEDLTVRAPQGYREMVEVKNRGRISSAGVASLFVGALSLGVGGLFASASDCANSSLPCFSGSGDLVVPLSIVGGLLVSLGAGLQAARLVEHHPAEPDSRADDIVYVNSPYLGSGGGGETGSPARTPME